MRFVVGLSLAPRRCQGGGDDTAKGTMRLCLPRPSAGAGPHHCHTGHPFAGRCVSGEGVLLQAHVRSDNGGPSTCCNGGHVSESINTRTRRAYLSCGRAVTEHAEPTRASLAKPPVSGRRDTRIPSCTSFPPTNVPGRYPESTPPTLPIPCAHAVHSSTRAYTWQDPTAENPRCARALGGNT